MRIPALPQQKEIRNRGSKWFFKRIRNFFSKRIIKKRPFVRVPPRK